MAISQSCLPYGITFTTQSQVDSFQVNYPGCTVIEGGVLITGEEITNLEGLNQITWIKGFLEIYDADSLTNLSGLESLGTVWDYLAIYDNDLLTDITALSSLSGTIDGLGISNNISLGSLAGLEGVTGIGFNLVVAESYLLTSLEGLNGITSIGHNLMIENNDRLMTLSGLESVTSVGAELFIWDNDTLADLSALIGIKRVNNQLHINNNKSLTNLSGLDSLESVGVHLNIWNNDSLVSLTGLNHLSQITSELSIYNNDALVDLAPLESLSSIGNLKIQENKKLRSLSGIDQLDPYSLYSIIIVNNDSLSTCEVKSVCEYLQTPNAWVYIDSNATGCNNEEEVEQACESISVADYPGQSYFSVYPNPANSIAHFRFRISQYQDVTLKIIDVFGCEIASLLDQQKPAGEHAIRFDVSALPPGIYLVRLMIGNTTQARAKLVVAR
jgi:hypothetical protein